VTIIQSIYGPNVEMVNQRKKELGKLALIKIARKIEFSASSCASYESIPMGDYPETMVAVANLYRQAANEAVMP
jgi:hypothetical protein